MPGYLPLYRSRTAEKYRAKSMGKKASKTKMKHKHETKHEPVANLNDVTRFKKCHF